METHVFNMGRKSPFSFLKDSFSSFLNPQTYCKTWCSASLHFIYVRKSFFLIFTYSFFIFCNKKSIHPLMLSLEFSFPNSWKEVEISQLPQSIKGTRLAKGLIPLYLSEVCNSCTWSWRHSLRALPDAAFACIPSVQRDYGYIAGRLTTPVFSFRQDVPNGNICFNLLFLPQIVDWYLLIHTWFPECRYS